jgi:acetyl esterase
VRVEDITLEGMHFRVVSPPTADGLLPTLIYYHGGCFVSGGFTTHDNQLRQLAMFSGCRVIAVQYRLAPEHTFPAAHDDAERGARLSTSTRSSLALMPRVSRWLATAPAGTSPWSRLCA